MNTVIEKLGQEELSEVFEVIENSLTSDISMSILGIFSNNLNQPILREDLYKRNNLKNYNHSLSEELYRLKVKGCRIRPVKNGSYIFYDFNEKMIIDLLGNKCKSLNQTINFLYNSDNQNEQNQNAIEDREKKINKLRKIVRIIK